jgi:3-phosphoshikimate 1-carboxyvinyltransferase
MSQYLCQPIHKPVSAQVVLPGSKSITNRALVMAALAEGHSILRNVLLAEDTWLMIEALRSLGIAITVDERGGAAEITGCRGFIPEEEASLFCGNSGTTIRFCTAVCALGHGRFELDGIARMRERPIGGLGSALQQLGGAIEYIQKEGFPPLAVHAHGLRGGEVTIDSPESSQMVSALLMAAPYAANDVLIELTGEIPSAPYLAMTTAMMEQFGVVVLASVPQRGRSAFDGWRFVVETRQSYHASAYAIEPDASNASYFLAAPAIAGGRVTVQGLRASSIQGDVRFVDVLERMGCRIERGEASLTVAGPGDRLSGIDVDLNDMPDMAPTLAVVALFAEGQTTIRNVATLRVKETDRLAALDHELTKLGAKVDEMPDGLIIQPPRSPAPATIETYNDHRMAMSFALAGLKVRGLRINDPECVAKTFPDFFARFERMCEGI